MSQSATVLMLHPSDELYGADKVLLEIAESVGRENVEVWLPRDIHYPRQLLTRELCARDIRVERHNTPVLRRANLNAKGLLRTIRDVWLTYHELRARAPSIVYLNTSAMLPAILAARLVGAKVLVHVHENLRGLERIALSALLMFADQIICVSQAIQQPIVGPARRKTTVIYNGFTINPSDAQPIDSGVLTVLLASRWNVWKGHEAFLRALSKSSRRDIQVTIAGGPPTSGQGVDVRALVHQLGLEEQCCFVGEVDDVLSLIDASHYVVVPSTLPDPLPTIAIESLARSCPVLASDTGGLPEIVDEGITGYLAEPNSEAEWVRRLETLGLPDATMRKACRSVFDERFSRDRFQLDIRRALSGVL